MIKKRVYIFLISLFVMLQNNITFWECNTTETNMCTIEDAPAEILITYIENLRKLWDNFAWEIAELYPENVWVPYEISRTKQKIQYWYNTIINWDWYYSLFDFYILYWTSNEYVPEIWRDYNMLDKEDKLLHKYLSRLIDLWYSDEKINIEKLCAGVINCNISWEYTIDILLNIIKNHEAVMDYYRLSIIGKRELFIKTIAFAPDNFKDQLYTHYNEFTTSRCSQCEGNFFNRVENQIKVISNWQELGKEGIQLWQDGIAILNGTLENHEYERLERTLLEKELRRQWLSMNASNKVLDNLDKFNENGWFSLDNNFITNSYDYLKNSIGSQIEEFRDSILEAFNKEKMVVPIETFWDINQNLNTTKQIEERINRLYQTELPSAQLEDNEVEGLEWQIIELHYDLSQWIWNLDTSVEVARKVCNDQWQWLGLCE